MSTQEENALWGLVGQQLTDLQKAVRECVESTSLTYKELQDIRRELLGNGQPGRIQSLETIQRYQSDQVKKHEAFVQRFYGKGTVVGALLGFIGYMMGLLGHYLLAIWPLGGH